ncbi:protein trichome birefringence-like 3 isoform X1 [Actinidia eriantha]|uniref:protein trichome birefringence-like 3 isoform X1 n=1 Tax=Actinidia eriantha TaxID=165200 RepID=UPI00258DF7AD|nr:protein trichome birefringence-like 3 isoform X1 [Actinidia eriantha]
MPLLSFYPLSLSPIHMQPKAFSMGTAKTAWGRPPFSIVALVICAFCFVALLYTERISSLSTITMFKLKSCSKREAIAKSIKSIIEDKTATEDDPVNPQVDDRFEFDRNECSVVDGKWVFNSSFKPLYSDRTCPYLDRQFTCVKNGRPDSDSDYRHWEWQLDDCILPRFNPKIALEKLGGKRLMFVGDSIQRNQWLSFVCLVESSIPQDQKSMQLGRSHSVFKAKEYNCTIEFYWAPFLVESNSESPIDPKKRILKVDSVSKHEKYWVGVDILAFNSYVWWMSATKVKALWGSFANGEEGYEELDTPVAYRIGMKTWANWVDSNVDPNTTRVFFTTMSPTHTRSADWNHEEGIKCYNETKPVMLKKGQWGSASANKGMMSVVANVVAKMKVPVTFINITQLSVHRVDAHASIYNELGGKLLTEDQKADPLHYADCIHWCLPGVPDTWNQIFLAYL